MRAAFSRYSRVGGRCRCSLEGGGAGDREKTPSRFSRGGVQVRVLPVARCRGNFEAARILLEIDCCAGTQTRDFRLANVAKGRSGTFA
jgi:hypothetical protein